MRFGEDENVFSISVAMSSLRSMTWVAPMDLRRSVLCKEAVIAMMEKPESFANWIATIKSDLQVLLGEI